MSSSSRAFNHNVSSFGRYSHCGGWGKAYYYTQIGIIFGNLISVQNIMIIKQGTVIEKYY